LETQTPQPVEQSRTLKIMYWLAAAAMAIAAVLEILNPAPDYMKVGSRVSLVVALLLLATARPAESRAKKVLIYALVAVALGLLLARLARGET
jgi:hypothetical protein